MKTGRAPSDIHSMGPLRDLSMCGSAGGFNWSPGYHQIGGVCYCGKSMTVPIGETPAGHRQTQYCSIMSLRSFRTTLQWTFFFVILVEKCYIFRWFMILEIHLRPILLRYNTGKFDLLKADIYFLLCTVKNQRWELPSAVAIILKLRYAARHKFTNAHNYIGMCITHACNFIITQLHGYSL